MADAFAYVNVNGVFHDALLSCFRNQFSMSR